MKKPISPVIVVGTCILLSACSSIRIGTDPRIVKLSGAELTYYCKLEEKMRTVVGVQRDNKQKKEFDNHCKKFLNGWQPSPTISVTEAQENLKKADENAQRAILNWEFKVTREEAHARYKGKEEALQAKIIELGREQRTKLHRFMEKRGNESRQTEAASKAFYEAAAELRRNQANLHACLDFSVGQALGQAISLNFRPIKDQCFLDVETLKAQWKELEEIKKALREARKK